MTSDSSDETIYHLATRSEFERLRRNTIYTPANFAADGFIHCSTRASTLAVANDYFGSVDEPLLLLAIDPSRLSARLVFEEPAPIAGGGTEHLSTAARFPHIYGGLSLDAVTGVAVLTKQSGRYVWPEAWNRLDSRAPAA